MRWILQEAWDLIPDHGTPTEQVEAFEDIVNSKVEELFPVKKVRMTNKDKDFITAELKNLKRKSMKEWKKNGKSEA